MTKIIKFIVTLLCTVQAQSNPSTDGATTGKTISSLECTDGNGKIIKHGDEFFPKKEDPCLKCSCQNGQMVMCRSVSCSPPKTCIDPVPIPGKCCEFHCKDGDGFVFHEEGVTPNVTGSGDSNVENTDGSSDSITTLGLRLVASTVTSFLVLALLLFMIHRLRQKRLLVAMRRYQNNRQRERLDEMDADSFSPEFLGIRCPPYEDPPPPYSPPKPEHMHQDAPPPYEVIDSQNINNNFTQRNGNQSSGANSYLPEHSNLTSTNHIQAADTGTNQNSQSHTNLDVINNNDIDEEVATIMTRGGEPVVRYTNSCYTADRRLSDRFDNCDVQRGAVHVDFTLPQGRKRRSHPRNRSEPRSSNRTNSRSHFMSYFPRHLDYDLWDESSTATSLSEYHTCRPSRRKSYLDNYSRTFDNSLPPYLSLHLDLDDTSTEASSNVTGYNPVCHHRYGSLPVNSSFSGQSTHTQNLSHDGGGVDNHYQIEQTTDQASVTENFKTSHDDDEEFNVSVSNMSSSYHRPCNSENTAAVNALENDSVLALEDRNRKLEQIFDSQKLRILRLSKLLQNPSGDNCFNNEHDVQATNPVYHPHCSGDMCRSQSQNSCLSICSETGEKKLTRLAESAIGNDAQYPENAIGGYPSLNVCRLSEDLCSARGSLESPRERNMLNHPIKQCGSNSSAKLVKRKKSSSDNHKYEQPEPCQPQNSFNGHCKINKNVNPSHCGSRQVKHSTAEKIVQTDKKWLGKTRSKSKSHKSDSTRKSRSESKTGLKGQELLYNGGQENQYEFTCAQERPHDGSITCTKPYGFVEELKSVQRHQGHQNCADDSANFSLADNGGIIQDVCTNNSLGGGYESRSTMRPYNNVKRSDSYSSGKSKSSSGGETTLLCPPSVTLAKRKSKSSKRLRYRKSCPAASSDVHRKKGQETMTEAD